MLALRLTAFALAAAALAAGPAASASAAAVPGEVMSYIAADLIADLEEFYGPGADGSGVDFTDATASPAHRVTGLDENLAPRFLNRWVTVISIGETVIGAAVVSIEPVSVSPQLDVYIADAAFGELVAALPDEATLVDDSAHSAWFSLADDTLTPLVAGTSGVTSPVALDTFRASLTPTEADAATAHPDASGGLLLAGLILALVVLLLAVEAFLPSWRRRAAAPATAIAGQPAAKSPDSRKKPTASN